MPAPPENLPLSFHRSQPYPGIDISNYAGKYKGKVLFITGASQGLGEHTAKAFAKAGANVFITARNVSGLERVKKEIEAENAGVKVGLAKADVSKEEDIKNAVQDAVSLFGRIDFVSANAGIAGGGKRIGESDVADWASIIDVNYKGSYIVARYTLPELVKTKGYIIFTSSVLAQARWASPSYSISKHVLNRFTEFVVEEYGKEGVKAFAIHPGAVWTEMNEKSGAMLPLKDTVFIDSPDLGAYTQVRLVSGSEDYLSGRFVSSNWDLDELAKYKEEILESDSLKNRLALPPSFL